MDDSDQFDIFDQEERDELIFKLFAHLIYGGPLNQYEDNIGPYFDITRDLYKDLVRYGEVHLEHSFRALGVQWSVGITFGHTCAVVCWHDLWAYMCSVAKDPSGSLYVNSVVVRVDELVGSSSTEHDIPYSCFTPTCMRLKRLIYLPPRWTAAPSFPQATRFRTFYTLSSTLAKRRPTCYTTHGAAIECRRHRRGFELSKRMEAASHLSTDGARERI